MGSKPMANTGNSQFRQIASGTVQDGASCAGHLGGQRRDVSEEDTVRHAAAEICHDHVARFDLLGGSNMICGGPVASLGQRLHSLI